MRLPLGFLLAYFFSLRCCLFVAALQWREKAVSNRANELESTIPVIQLCVTDPELLDSTVLYGWWVQTPTVVLNGSAAGPTGLAVVVSGVGHGCIPVDETGLSVYRNWSSRGREPL